MSNKQRNILNALFIIFLFCDLSYSFYRYLEQPLDGDLAPVVLPHPVYQRVLDDPFGYRTFTDTTMYAGSNRYFAHLSYSAFFNHVPFFFQKFFSPLDSLYIAAGSLRMLIHLILLVMISFYARDIIKANFTESLIIMSITTCFFQTGRLEPFFGLNQPSITYSAFYPLPMAMLMILFYPFVKRLTTQVPLTFSVAEHLLCIIMLVFVSFSGSLMPAVLILTIATFHFIRFYTSLKLFNGNLFQKVIRYISECKRTILAYSILMFIVAAYSMYLSAFNIENTFDHLALNLRYERMPKGLWNMIIANNAYLVFILLYIISVYLINAKLSKQITRNWRLLANGALIFVFLYTALLPFGGYRAYRALIIRSDSYIPVITLCVILFASASVLMVRYAIENNLRSLLLIPLIFIVYYTAIDNSNIHTNYCERESIQILQHSSETITVIPYKCNLMGWIPMQDLTYSTSNSELLYRWHITDKVKYYMHSTENP